MNIVRGGQNRNEFMNINSQQSLISRQISKTKEFSPIKLKSTLQSKKDGANNISKDTIGSIDPL